MNSIAAAKRRRAQPEGTKTPMPAPPRGQQLSPQAPPPTPPQPPATPQRLNPQQYLSMLESKILALEKNMTSRPAIQIEVNGPDGKKQMELSDYMAEIDQKFMVLAEELSTLKDSMLKLQSFTMEVNQTLFTRLENNIQVSENITQSNDELNEIQTLEPINEENEAVPSEDEVILNTLENITLDDNTQNENEEITEDTIVGVTKKKGKKKH